jgi:ubiquitin carboxyl-terminal hydrolase 34
VSDPDQEPIVIGSSEDEPGSPPIMIIDDDDEADDFGVHMDAVDQFRQFPYSNRSSYSKMVGDLGLHINGTTICSSNRWFEATMLICHR